MLKNNMYVRTPMEEDLINPRDFGLGKVTSVDEFAGMVTVRFFDCNNISRFYPLDVTERKFSIKKITHCRIRNNSRVQVKNNYYLVKAYFVNHDDDYLYYYLQDSSGNVSVYCESDIIATYNDSYINPLSQLRKYEFQNPMWYMGRSVVSKTMNTINNSLYGFKELAGCKIMLKPYQLKTVMRCLKDEKCRIMIADEVGLGKTIEALSVLKVFLLEKNHQKVLITTPDSLVEQWKTELAFKFKLFEGINVNDNYIDIIGISSLKSNVSKYDFIIVDEVHRYLENPDTYQLILNMSLSADNIIMLSATPLQKRNDEYKKLLSLIQPSRYLKMSNDSFNNLLEAQSKIVRCIFNALDEFDALNEVIEDSNGICNEEIEEIFESTTEELENISSYINDDYFDKLLEKVDISALDFGVEAIQNCIAYVCENYQMEKSIIRNRRKKISLDEHVNTRCLVDISYEVDNDFNNDEWNAYKSFSEWIENSSRELDFKKYYIPVIHSLFSSGSAYLASITELSKKIHVDSSVLEYAKKYALNEKNKCKKIKDYLNEPDLFACKLVNIIDYIDQECENLKVLIFTSFIETFDVYKQVLLNVFGEETCCFFNSNMESDDLELNVYKFQNRKNSRILLSDESGGEGRNFQNADVIIHIDIPWSANDLEQRIGRLDRIGRSKDKDVLSVVSYGIETTEESLFKLWNDGLNIFKQSQSGLEIIMNDIDLKIVDSLNQSFKYGLDTAQNELEEIIKTQMDALKKEQVFDIASYQYQDLNKILDNTVEKYNENETQLFGDAMMSWASLSGFHGSVENNDIITFALSTISIKSLSNTMFIPPDMKALIEDKLNTMRNRIRALANDRIKHLDNSYIRGTFNRNVALSNDYLNFFAPGDDIFDCITNNALNSYKGTCSCFATKGKINWTGFMFTWRIQLDDKLIFDNGLSSHIIDQYRGYIPSGQMITPFELSDSGLNENVVISEFVKTISSNIENWKSVIHLGKRSGNIIDKFKKEYPKEKWNTLVDEAYKLSLENAKNKYASIRKNLLLALKKELMSLTCAEKAISKYYNSIDISEKVSKENSIIFDVISKASIVLDSVCYVVIENE